MYIKIKLFGNSFHPMLVAYPVVLYTATLVAFVVYFLQREPFWFRLGHVANKAAVMMALVTLLPGLLGWLFGVSRDRTQKHGDHWYMLLNLGALALFSVTALMNAGKWDDKRPEILLPLLFSLAGVAMTLAAGFYGWTVVQNYGGDEGSLWQWQVRATRLTEELEQARAENAQLRAELEGAQSSHAERERIFTEPERAPSWTSMANQTWTALADQSWFSTRETHANPIKLVVAIVVTVGAVAFLSLAPNLIGLR